LSALEKPKYTPKVFKKTVFLLTFWYLQKSWNCSAAMTEIERPPTNSKLHHARMAPLRNPSGCTHEKKDIRIPPPLARLETSKGMTLRRVARAGR